MIQIQNMTPKQIVAELDKYIIGQDSAKRSVAVALRNRYRRNLLSEEMREEISPKNILMMGPTPVKEVFNTAMFDFRRLVAAPIVIVAGIVIEVVAIMGKFKN